MVVIHKVKELEVTLSLAIADCWLAHSAWPLTLEFGLMLPAREI